MLGLIFVMVYLNIMPKTHLINPTIPGLIRAFEAFLRMCDKAGITLNPAKIRI